GDESAPYGAGAHPYLTCNLQSIDSCVLTLPASEELPADRDFSQKVCSSMPVVILENVCRKWHGKDGWKTARLFTAHWLKRDYGC
ncbi:hypothetical protein MJO10_31125, partial [Salmonella enterica subsp. enterica serovar Anatum]|nr:hypothetical protein [Salmonella enterica subsp. enterica serovar Anatum]